VTVLKQGRHDDMEISAFGVNLRASGRTVVLVVCALGILAFSIWHDFKSTNQNATVVEELRNMAYVLTLTEAERKRLNLAMPESLRARSASGRPSVEHQK